MSTRSLDDAAPRISKRAARDCYPVFQGHHRISSYGLDCAVRRATDVGKGTRVKNQCAPIRGLKRASIGHAAAAWLDNQGVLTQSQIGIDRPLIRQRQEAGADVTCSLNRLLVRKDLVPRGVAE